MDFAEADRRYALLRQRYDAQELSSAAFDNALRDLMVLDEQGRWWAKSRETGDWNYKDPATGAWVRAQPPGVPVKPPVASQPPKEPNVSRSAGRAEEKVHRGATVLLPAEGEAPSASGLSGMALLVLYAISLIVPLLGFVVYGLLRNRPIESDRKAARVVLILAIICIIYWFFRALGG